jgi:hypothetical protein
VVNTDLVDHKTIFSFRIEHMPGWAEVRFTGCVIWMRTMKEFASKALPTGKALIYTLAVTNMQLDIYCIPVLEQILKDKGFAPTEEPFKKFNQG